MNDWRSRLEVPRAAFVPPDVWIETSEGFTKLSRAVDEPRWRALVEADEPIVTQVDDGRTPPGGFGRQPSSSCSKPSLVADMLDALDVREGQVVLEIGAGTGWNAALLAERVGADGRVVSLELDPRIAAGARRVLAGRVMVVGADGSHGYAACAPYDRIISTAAVRRIPAAWIRQTRPGGLIVVPWGTDYADDALTRLEVHEDGTASGRCGRVLAFMRLRGQRRSYLEPTGNESAAADESVTDRTGREFFAMVDTRQAAFTIGLRVPRCACVVDDVDAGHRRLELQDAWSGSWARIDLVRGGGPSRVSQSGSRRLWDEVDRAYRWWLDAGRPAPHRYGLTVTPDGEHSVWLDSPRNEHWFVDLV